jgi:hypothetical protein
MTKKSKTGQKSKVTPNTKRASLTMNMNNNAPDNPVPKEKFVSFTPQVDTLPDTTVKKAWRSEPFDKQGKKMNPPLASSTNERGDTDLGNLQQKIESGPKAKLKQYLKVKK